MIIALVSKKGGVGKTTTAVNLAAALAARQRRVLLVDLDSQASASLSLGVDRSRFAPSSADLLLDRATLSEVLRRSTVPGLDLITGSVDLISIDYELGGLRGKDGRLATKLAPLAPDYDYVLLDCPPSLSLLSVNALVAADGFIVPAVPQYLAIEGIRNLLTATERLCMRAGTRTRLLGVLLTMVDYRVKVSRTNVDLMRSQLGNQVFAVEIRINVRLAEAPSYGQPIFGYDPHSTGARAYDLLADELLLRTAGLVRSEPLEDQPLPQPQPALSG